MFNLADLEPNYNTKGDIALKKQTTLRKLVGLLGMLLPVALWAFLEVDTRFSAVLPSISHYYHTRACGIFIIAVSSLAIFLLVYKGEEKSDFYASSTAGFAALILLLLPTGNIIDTRFLEVSVTKLRVNPTRETLHYLAAAVFLLSLAYISFFLFTKSDCPPSKRSKAKIKRNRIYRTTAIIMVLAMFLIFLRFLKVMPLAFNQYYDFHCLTFWMEVVAVESFGFAWLIKGETFFLDHPEKNNS